MLIEQMSNDYISKKYNFFKSFTSTWSKCLTSRVLQDLFTFNYNQLNLDCTKPVRRITAYFLNKFPHSLFTI